jgi:integrase
MKKQRKTDNADVAKTQAKPAPKRWTPTRVQNLVRHKSGVYYARIRIGGKETWRSLRTSLLEVAKARLAQLTKETLGASRAPTKPGHRMTMEEAIQKRLDIIATAELKPSTKHYYNQCADTLLKTWPDIKSMPAARLTESDCTRWAASIKASPQRFNNVVGFLRSVFEVAIAEGHRFGNPADAIKKRSIPKKKLELPSLAQFHEWVDAMRNRGGRFSRKSAAFVELLAYSGMRRSEGQNLLWRDVDFDKGIIIVRGDPETGTKNGEERHVPMIPALRALLEKISPLKPQANAAVSSVGEAQHCMDAAAEEVGMTRITHHDLRHFFATICIESGVDIPTVSRWLGHSDGGALAMRTYGHLRDEHSRAAAQRVAFGAPATPEPENLVPFRATA